MNNKSGSERFNHLDSMDKSAKKVLDVCTHPKKSNLSEKRKKQMRDAANAYHAKQRASGLCQKCPNKAVVMKYFSGNKVLGTRVMSMCDKHWWFYGTK